jgi:hypothetical protein
MIVKYIVVIDIQDEALTEQWYNVKSLYRSCARLQIEVIISSMEANDAITSLVVGHREI